MVSDFMHLMWNCCINSYLKVKWEGSSRLCGIRSSRATDPSTSSFWDSPTLAKQPFSTRCTVP